MAGKKKGGVGSLMFGLGKTGLATINYRNLLTKEVKGGDISIMFIVSSYSPFCFIHAKPPASQPDSQH